MDNKDVGIESLPLLPRHKIYLQARGGNPRKFIRQFRECWKRLPLSVRRQVLAYWREQTWEYCPLVELSNMWAGSRSNFAQVRNYGQELRFDAESFQYLPNQAAHWIIAHELAHVYQKVIGRQPGGRSEEHNESEADRFTESWGFEEAALYIVKRNLKRLGIQDACELAKEFFD